MWVPVASLSFGRALDVKKNKTFHSDFRCIHSLQNNFTFANLTTSVAYFFIWHKIKRGVEGYQNVFNKRCLLIPKYADSEISEIFSLAHLLVSRKPAGWFCFGIKVKSSVQLKIQHWMLSLCNLRQSWWEMSGAFWWGKILSEAISDLFSKYDKAQMQKNTQYFFLRLIRFRLPTLGY